MALRLGLEGVFRLSEGNEIMFRLDCLSNSVKCEEIPAPDLQPLDRGLSDNWGYL
jgi:hypothetical protein